MDSFAFMTLDQSEITQFVQVPWKSNPGSIKHLPLQELIALIDRFGLSKHGLENVEVNLEGHSTIVPAALFDPAQWWIYLQQLHPELRRDDICYLRYDQMVIVYAYPLGLRRVLSTMLPESLVRPFVASMLGFFDRASGGGDKLSAVHSNGQLFLLMQSQGQRRLVNRYTATTTADVVYYALLAADQLGLEPSSTSFRFAGSKPIVKEVRNLLAAHFLHFEVIDWVNGWRLPTNVIDPIEIFDLYCVQHENNLG